MTITLKNTLVVMAILSLIAMTAIYFASTFLAEAGNPGNLPVNAATSSRILLAGAGVTPYVIAEPSSGCSARIVSTGFHNVLLAFEGDRDPSVNGIASTTLTLAIGHWQAASTTVAYPAENYGCGWVTGIVGETNGVADLASSTIGILETF